MAFSPGYELTPLQKEHNDWPSQYLNFLSLLIRTGNGPNYRSVRLFLSLSWMLQYSFCYMFQFFGHKACGILAPQLGMELVPPALEGRALTPGLPGKFHQ